MIPVCMLSATNYRQKNVDGVSIVAIIITHTANKADLR